MATILGDCLDVMKKKKQYKCPVCDKDFFKTVYKKQQAVYCNQKCAYIGRTMGFTKRVIKKPYNIKEENRKKPRICLVCQKSYMYTKSTQKYCCRKCFEISHKKRMKGKNNPSYIDGRSKDTGHRRHFRGDDWETLRKEIYKRDNYICRECGVHCIGKKEYLKIKDNANLIIQCHHLDKGKTNNNKVNLITLCLGCHSKIHQFK